MCTFLFWMVHCGIWGRCIVGICEINCSYTKILHTALTKVKPKSDFKNTPHTSPLDEPWGGYGDHFGEKMVVHNGTAPYKMNTLANHIHFYNISTHYSYFRGYYFFLFSTSLTVWFISKSCLVGTVTLLGLDRSYQLHCCKKAWNKWHTIY